MWAAIFFGLTACSKARDPAEKPADVAYYTCTMHPSVKSHDPHGKCPICSMNLVPVMKKEFAAQNAASTETETNERPATFTVPLERQQQIGVTYGTIQNRALTNVLRGFGTVAYDEQRHWDYVARVGGYVQQLSVFSRGERVEKDAPLLTIYSPDLLTTENEYVNLLKSRDDAKKLAQQAVLESAERLVEAARQR
jgi:Cu(I)/Ag(I) efflux system membrane fusion protein